MVSGRVSVFLWDLNSGFLIHRRDRNPNANGALTVALARDDGYILYGGMDQELRLWNLSVDRLKNDICNAVAPYILDNQIFSEDEKGFSCR